VLVVTAHPDDVDFGAGGTVASWTAAGTKVSYCVCTRGEASGQAGADRAETATRRMAEQRAAAAVLGVEDVTFLDHPDGAVTPSLQLRKDIARVIREVRPERVLTWSPQINWDRIVTSHPDHRAVGEATIAAVYPDARNPHAFPELLDDEGLEPWSVGELWIGDPPGHLPNHVVDVTDTFDRKIEALRSHVSQVGAWANLDADLRAVFGAVAAKHGLADGRMGEEFQVVALPS
jgi:LmbE family N-acetylglucosaminyl deacetylase